MTPEEILAKIVQAGGRRHRVAQKAYREPVKEKLIAKRVSRSRRPRSPRRLSIPRRRRSTAPSRRMPAPASSWCNPPFYRPPPLQRVQVTRHQKFWKANPVIVGNCVLQRGAGAHGVRRGRDLVGLGPARPAPAACWDRRAAGDRHGGLRRPAIHFKQSGRYVPVITGGGMRTGSNVHKAFACGPAP